MSAPPSASHTLPDRTPEIGELVHVRSRRWLVENVRAGAPNETALVSLACADDDAQGEALDVFWEYELDRRILAAESWDDLAAKGFDPQQRFAAFLHTLRWSCVTSTDPSLFQAPFRAGITIDAYQMEPLRKALLLPRVNLFIADDTGLGKTIEAGLIARELLLRKKAKLVVVAAPASVLDQWKGELEDRFGLVFEVLDRAYLARMRRERGFGVNPWRTHSRFLISHNLLIDETYAAPMREWLADPARPEALLILDEAHHAAPASGRRYGIETQFTRAIRDLGHRFEHRLFLSATPHNGHSSSFSTLLELLDPYRFTRGVAVKGKRELEHVMVRRLKEDLRALQGGFPERKVVAIRIEGLASDAPELVLSRLLEEYREVRERRFVAASKRARASASLLVVGLQQRLLSSIEAFARTLAQHRKTSEAQWAKATLASKEAPKPEEDPAPLFVATPNVDDDETPTAEQTEAREADEIRALNAAAESPRSREGAAEALWREEQALLGRMQAIAEGARSAPDAKTLRLIDWIRANLCPELPAFGSAVRGAAPRWRNRRVLIFTENREGTKRFLREVLQAAIEGSERADERIEVIDGLTSSARRKEIQRAFNTDPAEHPLRILLATDAAREGLNFQAHCADLFHFDLPWNPGRIEQRNGRIDRKLQPEPEVRCHYFVLTQRVEDRVLDVLVRKTKVIKEQLGSLSKVIDDDIERLLLRGIRHGDEAALTAQIEAAGLDAERQRISEEELEDARDRREKLGEQIAECQKLVAKSREWVGFKSDAFRDAISCSLEILGADPLREERDAKNKPVWVLPPLDRRAAADASWTATLDTLRAPRPSGQKLEDWRVESPVRPVIFEDAGVLTESTVHLHLEQRVAQRLLARFRSQGFLRDISRACLAQSADGVPRVLLLGRLALYGRRAERLHEELVPIAARWLAPAHRSAPLRAYARDAEERTLTLLEDSLAVRAAALPKLVQDQLLASAPRDIEELLPQLEARAREFEATAREKLAARGKREADELARILERQRDRVAEKLAHFDAGELDDLRAIAREEERLRQLSFLPEQQREKDDALTRIAEERRQLTDNARWWRERGARFEKELTHEPARIREFYEVRATRIEPVGLVYLWPGDTSTRASDA